MPTVRILDQAYDLDNVLDVEFEASPTGHPKPHLVLRDVEDGHTVIRTVKLAGLSHPHVAGLRRIIADHQHEKRLAQDKEAAGATAEAVVGELHRAAAELGFIPPREPESV